MPVEIVDLDHPFPFVLGEVASRSPRMRDGPGHYPGPRSCVNAPSRQRKRIVTISPFWNSTSR